MVGNFKRIGGTVVLGACMALAACGKSDDARRTDSATAAGDVMADTTARVPDTTARMTDTTATAMNATGVVGDTAILAQIQTANKGEIAEGKMAEHKSANADIKAFARMTVADHMAMNKKANAVAAKLNITAAPDDKATDMKGDAAGEMKALADTPAKDFDKKYINDQVDGHQKVLGVLNDARKNAKSPEVVSLIDGAIPIVQKHLDRAKEIQTTLSK